MIHDPSFEEPSTLSASIRTRYAIIGMPLVQATRLAEQIGEKGIPTAIHPTFTPSFTVSPDKLASPATRLVLVCSGGDPLGAIDVVERLADTMNVILLDSTNDVDLLKKALRAGCRAVFDPDTEIDQLREAVLEFRNHTAERRKLGRIIAVLGSQGGAGTTTIAVGLAQLLARAEYRNVLVADMDVSAGDIAMALDLDRCTSTRQLLRRIGLRDDAWLRDALNRHQRGFWVLPQPPEDVDSSTLTDDDVAALLGGLMRSFTHVVLDMGSRPDPGVRRAMAEADDLVLVMPQQTHALPRALRRLDIAAEVGLPVSRIQLVVNRYSARSAPTIEDVERELRHPITATITNDYATAASALDRGRTVFQASPRGAIAHDVGLLKARMLGESEHSRLQDMVFGTG